MAKPLAGLYGRRDMRDLVRERQLRNFLESITPDENQVQAVEATHQVESNTEDIFLGLFLGSLLIVGSTPKPL